MERYNIKAIEVDQSVLINTHDHTSLRVTVSNHAKRFGKKFTCTKTNEGILVKRLS